jgi:hypothetical protein
MHKERPVQVVERPKKQPMVLTGLLIMVAVVVQSILLVAVVLIYQVGLVDPAL